MSRQSVKFVDQTKPLNVYKYNPYKIVVKREVGIVGPRFRGSDAFKLISDSKEYEFNRDTRFESCGNLMIDVANNTLERKTYDVNRKGDIEKATKWIDRHLIYFKVYQHTYQNKVEFNLSPISEDQDEISCSLYGMMVTEKFYLEDNFGTSRITDELLEEMKSIVKQDLQDFSDYFNGDMYTITILLDGKKVAKYLGLHDHNLNEFLEMAKRKMEEDRELRKMMEEYDRNKQSSSKDLSNQQIAK